MISKQKAKDLAKILLAKKQQNLNDLKTVFSDNVRQEYLKNLPSNVIKNFEDKEIKPFIKSINAVQIVGEGFNYESIAIISAPSSSNYSAYLRVDNTNKKELRKSLDTLNKAKKDFEENREKLESALFSLRTEKRILEIFPELSKELGESEKKNLPSLNINEIRKLIK